MPLLDGLRVVKSGIHGYGAVTTRSFAKGETICFGDGVLYDEDDDFDDTYALILPAEDSGLAKNLFWDLVCQTRWFNHSCDPNTEVMAEWDAERNSIVAWWVALRDIQAGEEITYDYAFVADCAEPCACRSPNCRGLIVDPDPTEVEKLPDHLRPLLRAPDKLAG